MKIYFKYKTGLLKGYTIRVSKNGWYHLYNDRGISQTNGKYSLKELRVLIKEKKRSIFSDGLSNTRFRATKPTIEEWFGDISKYKEVK